MKNYKRELFFLRSFAVTTVLSVSFFIFYLLNREPVTQFDTIDVQRINVVEKNGDLKLVISNSENQHSGIINGRPIPERKRPAGLIFFNSMGDECGGLIYDAMKKEAGLILSVDQFQEDQIMQLNYYENPELKKRRYGLQLWDYPKENAYNARMDKLAELSKLESREEQIKAYKQMQADSLLSNERLFVGKKINNDFGLFINDDSGKPRIKIYIDSNNEPRMEFLDEKGEVVIRK